jgi:DUF4097 and DUF4098 domain-containing protein YvlB
MRMRNLVCAVYLVTLLALVAGVSRTQAGSDHRHSRTISERRHGAMNDCSDLHTQFDDQDALVRSEERTVSKGEASMLQIHSHPNGGVQVTGWDKDSYSVTACKAVAPGSSAEKTLSQIAMTIDGGKVSTRGPSNEDDWTVYLLIRAPKSAVIDVDTENGPVAIYDLGGKLTAHAHNGPISLENFSGDADVTAVNGPIRLEGSSGNVKIHTQNGPISVDLAGTNWIGTGLSADAQNGPVTLRVPSGYQSGFVVESRGYSPVSCRASVCGDARKTWDDDHKRIEYGAAPAVIRMSTVNGPVAVED